MADEDRRQKSRSAARSRRPNAAAIEDAQGMDDGEKSLHALGLAASPEERWDLWEKQMRSNGYWQPSKRTAFNA